MTATLSGIHIRLRSEPTPPPSLEGEVVALFEQLRVPVIRYLLSTRLPLAEAEEITQEVFLLLFRHLRMGKPRENLRGWVFRVAHNLGLKQRSKRLPDANLGSFFLESLPDPAPRPDQRLETRQRQQRLLAVVRAMPGRDQCCLALRAEGLQYREIAGVLGISLGSVAKLLERALSRLERADRL